MSAYMVFNYAITDPEGYKAYLPAAMPTLGPHGVEVLVADYQSEPKEGISGPRHRRPPLRLEGGRPWLV
jgi:uncharacterized protein (DUF1330 family)